MIDKLKNLLFGSWRNYLLLCLFLIALIAAAFFILNQVFNKQNTLFPGRRGGWVIEQGSQTLMRAVHMSGNWGGNTKGVKSLDPKYFEFLRDLNANWVGISVAHHLDDSLDSTVERVYSRVDIPTFKDEDL